MFGLPSVIAKMFNTNNTKIGKAMMIWAKCNQIAKIVSSAFCSRGDVVSIYGKIKSAYSAPVLVADKHLFLNVSPSPSAPVAVVVPVLWVVFCEAKAIAVISFFHLAWEKSKFSTAIITLGNYFARATRCGCQSLPCTIAHILTTSYAAILMGICIKRITAYRTSGFYLPAAPIAIIVFFVLVSVDKPGLLGRVFGFSNFLPTATSAIDAFIGHIIVLLV